MTSRRTCPPVASPEAAADDAADHSDCTVEDLGPDEEEQEAIMDAKIGDVVELPNGDLASVIERVPAGWVVEVNATSEESRLDERKIVERPKVVHRIDGPRSDD